MDSVFSVSDVLAQDLSARMNREVRDADVISVRQLKSKKWDYHLPTLKPSLDILRNIQNVDSAVSHGALKMCKKPRAIMARFLAHFGCFKGVDMSGILVAGGSVLSCIFDLNEMMDADLFLYGIPLEDVPKRIEKLVRELDLPAEGEIVKSAFATTISYKINDQRRHIQIVHRLYTNPSEVLHGFDLGSCAVGILFDKKRVITTSLGRVSLEYQINLLDLSKRSTTYAVRLAKYFHRGFSIVLPDLSLEAIGREKMFTLDDMFVKLRRSKDKKLSNKLRASVVPQYSSYGSDYGDEIVYNLSTFSSTNVTNQRKIIWGATNLSYTHEWCGIEDLVKSLTDTQLHVIADEHVCNPINRQGTIKTERMVKIFGEDEACRIVSKLIKADQQERSVIRGEVFELYKEKVQKAVNACNEAGGYKVKWMVVDPGTQIVGSFNPTTTTKEMFYGRFLKK